MAFIFNTHIASHTPTFATATVGPATPAIVAAILAAVAAATTGAIAAAARAAAAAAAATATAIMAATAAATALCCYCCCRQCLCSTHHYCLTAAAANSTAYDPSAEVVATHIRSSQVSP